MYEKKLDIIRSVVAGFIQGFFGKILYQFSTEDLKEYIEKDLDLVKYTDFDKHQGTYNALVPLFDGIRNKMRGLPIHIDPGQFMLKMMDDFLTYKAVMDIVRIYKREWLPILANIDQPAGYLWLKRNINKLKVWAERSFTDPNYYNQQIKRLDTTNRFYPQDNKMNTDPIDRKFQV